jgi:glycogenin glucosyltransferase
MAAIPKPSYAGPGLAFEKGEDIPTPEAPALPTEEQQDVLETWPGEHIRNVGYDLY